MAGEDWSGTALNLSMSMELATLAGRGVEVKVILQVRKGGRFEANGEVPGWCGCLLAHPFLVILTAKSKGVRHSR
jgi:hypothetical protein